MTPIPDEAAPARFCICYARKDDELRGELHSHLSPLERCGLIQSWYDRNISAGERWKDEIDEHLRNADFILLLISSDFVASEYCYNVEMKFALKRHEEATAVVVPILLRPVEFAGLPFAEIQALPGSGQFIAGETRDTPNRRDELFASVAKDIREAIQALRTKRLQVFKSRTGAEWVLQRRFLDAAVAKEIPKGETREVAALVSIDGSDGLRFLLDQDGLRGPDQRTYSAVGSDVRSSGFEIEFQLTPAGFLRTPSFFLRLMAPGFVPAEQNKRVAIPTLSDSKPYSFIVQGDQEGQHTLNVELICNDVAVVEQLLRTRVVQHSGPEGSPPTSSVVMASIPLPVTCVARAATAGSST